ncbi:uncharacterized protein LOC124413223 isoform X2 [Diprion similis]|uniref:uncharacterized protein LOC124413223 isoform X2 n=1 Tax=Diprion similis TaxID=362088 RepID=UPI001EF8518E|nr:uncharacterized protein LOC124413223 isoform X2 [Diprion similis]
MSHEILHLLCSPMKLERDQAISELNKILPASSQSTVQQFKNALIAAAANREASWETKYGCLLGTKIVVSYLNIENEHDQLFINKYKDTALQYLIDDEPRIRIAAGEVLGALCAKAGPLLYSEIKTSLVNLLSSQIDSQNTDQQQIMHKIASSSETGDSSTALETTLKCLQNIAEGCGHEFQPFIDAEMLNLVFRSTKHSCRFVREAAFYLCASLVTNAVDEHFLLDYGECDNTVINTYGNEFAHNLSSGLSDNWSQVRLAASVATRKFLVALPMAKSREAYYPELLPKICLNRYYVAEGVRNYSQETWRQVTGPDGKALVERFVNETVNYYIKTTQSDNHAVREAACSCIAELATKIDSECVRPHVQQLLSALGICFQDDFWPVRDAACLACGSLIQTFPQESQKALPSLYPMFFRNLEDPIASVRQDAAIGLSNIVRAYGTSALAEVHPRMVAGLNGVRNQPDSSLLFSEPNSKLNTNYTSTRRCPQVADPTDDVPMYKYNRHTDLDHVKRKPSEPWELADGCLHLLGELAMIGGPALNVVTEILPLLAEISKLRHYSNHLQLLENLCKTLPIICTSIGKKYTKSLVQDFFDSIFYALESENALTSSAASQCLNTLSSLIGPSILRAKVQSYNPSYLHHLDANIHIAPL